MTDSNQSYLAKIERLERRLTRERNARREAELISEQVVRDLYDKQLRVDRLTDEQLTLQRLTDELETANRLKSQFLATISHELRTPLSAIIGFSELLLDGADGELAPDAMDDVGQIQRSGRALLGLINDILDFSRIDAGRMTVKIEMVDLRPIVWNIIAELGPRTEGKPIHLRAEMPETPTMASCDGDRVRQVLTNLAANAIKFTDHGEVKFRIDEITSEELEISVVDTGIGIPQEAQMTIFKEFVQVDGSTTRNFGGTGLGLAISRKMIELQGGSIGVESTPGVGSRFWVRLRRYVESLEPARLQEPGENGSSGQPTEARGSSPGDRILVVDGDPAPSGR